MPKQSPVPDALDKPYFDALNEDRLVIQNWTCCQRLQHPPAATCGGCGSNQLQHMSWKQVSGNGTIYSYGVVYDSPIAVLQADQPYNVALIELEEDPGVKMLSHLPGRAVDDVPIGAKVKVIFETTPATGQKVPEWQVVS
ncbi:MAG: hypothetical protein FJ035_06905 [Chloroflexi bacterium]|nr:hypothetical protein [Chloroflexota bacterium]